MKPNPMEFWLAAEVELADTRATYQPPTPKVRGLTDQQRQRNVGAAEFTDPDVYLPEPEPWKLKGACRGHMPAMWYSKSQVVSDAAKAICATCPVQPECLEYALARRERWGIWGGLGEMARRRILRERRAA